MQVNVIDGGRQAFNAMLYNVPSQNTLHWLNNNISRAKNVLGGVADGLVDASINLYNRVNSSSVINAAKELVGSQGGHGNQYMIYGLSDRTMGGANYIMQQYIMANPQVQRLYNDNMCYGFEETYFNPEPGVYGEDRYDYQRVMSGVLQEDDEDNCMVIKHYSNCDETEISVNDQFLILESWAHAENMILNGIDPTDPDMGKL